MRILASRPRSTRLAWIALFAAWNGSALAADRVVVLAAKGSTLRPGELVELRLPAVPADAEELEVLVTLGRSGTPARITGELPASTRAVTWRVPNLPTRELIFTVRYGRRGSEEVAFTSGAFAIVPAALPGVVPVRARGELWLAEAPPPAPEAGALASRGSAMRALQDDEAALERIAAASTERRSPAPESIRAVPLSRGPAPASSSCPTVLPLRI